ncbi:MAG: hypothetical protein JW779_05775 [Candidatus Thorarchaeota archaeon]|nr:hypothetical protein [Candidatus Thorarchaeota archaeon]
MQPLLFFSLFMFAFMIYLDNRGKNVKPESMIQKIDSVLFSSVRRAMVVYFISGLGVPIDIILFTYSDYLIEPLLFSGLYCISLLVVILGSVFYARNRERGN